MRLSDSQVQTLAQQIGQADNDACCGDNSAGLHSGITLVLSVLGVDEDQRKLISQKSHELSEALYEAMVEERDRATEKEVS